MIGETVASSVEGSTGTRRHVNRMIREIVLPASDADLIGFFCECADPGCHKVLWFTADAFDRARADPSWYALSPGHAHPESPQRS